MARLRSALVPATAALLLAAPSAAQAWPTRTVATGGPAFHRDVAALSGGRVATLLERGVSGSRTLELWIGEKQRVVARAKHTFAPAQIGVDADGDAFVVYATNPDSGGGRRLYSW